MVSTDFKKASEFSPKVAGLDINFRTGKTCWNGQSVASTPSDLPRRTYASFRKIRVNKFYLSSEYLKNSTPAVREIADNFEDLLATEKPMNYFFFGFVGSGKSTFCKAVLEALAFKSYWFNFREDNNEMINQEFVGNGNFCIYLEADNLYAKYLAGINNSDCRIDIKKIVNAKCLIIDDLLSEKRTEASREFFYTCQIFCIECRLHDAIQNGGCTS